MATLNPFDLLGDDAEDPTQLAVALPKKVAEKPAATKVGKLPTKPPPPSQAVRESKNVASRGRGDGGARGGSARGRGGFNRDFRNNDAPRNENGYSGGYRGSDERDGSRRGGSVGEYRGGRGGGGGRRGGYSNGESGDFDRPRRTYERRSGTGRGNDLKRDGAGRGNWGTTEDDIVPVTEEPTTEVEKSPVAENEGEVETADAVKETPPADEQAEKEPEDNEITLEEYEKILEEKKKALQATKVEERKVDTKVFESMKQLSNKKTTDEEIFVKLGSEKDKRRDAAEKEEKAKKSLSINEFLKPAEGESYNPRGGYRGRGGRGGGRGQRGERGNGGGYQRNGGGAAPAIGDTAQFPSLG